MSFLGGGGKANFDRLLESATNQINLEPNWATNLEICDSIRQNDVTIKYAVAAMRKKIKDPNPHVSKFSLIVLETCVKNCGQSLHEEIATHEFMEDMRTLAQTGSAPVKEQVLSMLQAWNHAFRNNTKFQPILATYNLMKMEGYHFPPLSESDAMFSADVRASRMFKDEINGCMIFLNQHTKAPTWKDGDVCHMCRVKFGTFTRQHHCRACGEVFCSKCSSKQSIIPKIGIEREVRVCDPCYDEINPNGGNLEADGARPRSDSSELPAEYLSSDLAKEAQTKPKLSETEVKAQEEEEMQLALALSLSEEESNKNASKNWSARTNLYEMPKSEPVVETRKAEPRNTLFSNAAQSLQSMNESENSELSKYLDRSYWERKSAENNNTRQPSAPVVQENSVDVAVNNYATESDSDEEVVNSDVFIQTMEKSIEKFVERMNTVCMKGKHIAMDSTVQSLFQSLSVMHPQLIKLLEDEEDSKAKYEAMLQKLAVIREARESLNDMRAQYQEKTRQQELEQEMLRRMQMEQKLELMRQQKQEYLEYQRLLQVQRQQDLDVYQQEKLRQKQLYAVQPQFAGYPDPMQHVGDPIVTRNMTYNNAQDYPSLQQNINQQRGMQEQYQVDQPPQYPGMEPDVRPPSYALATNAGYPVQQPGGPPLQHQGSNQSQSSMQKQLPQQQVGLQQHHLGHTTPVPSQQQLQPGQQMQHQVQPNQQHTNQALHQSSPHHKQPQQQQQTPNQQFPQSQPYQTQSAYQQQLNPQQQQVSQPQLAHQPSSMQQPQFQQIQPQQQFGQPQQEPPQPQQLPPQPQHHPPQPQHQPQHQPPQPQHQPPQPQHQPPQPQQQQQQLPPQQQPHLQQGQHYQQYPPQQQQDFQQQQQQQQFPSPQQQYQQPQATQYPPNMQQPGNYQQQFSVNQPIQDELSANMKDLQLISFD